MPYWENVTRSFRIAWNHKYLWLIALFSGEAGGTNFNYSQSTPTRGGTSSAQQISDAQASALTWLSDHASLVILLIVIWLVLVVAFFILAALTGNSTAGGFIAALGLLLLIAIPYVIYLTLLDRLGSRAIVLEQLMARAGLARGHRLLLKRLGRTLLVWLLSV